MKSLKDFFNPERSLLYFFLGTAALTIFIQIVYDIFKEYLGLWGGIGLAVLLVLILLSIIYIERRWLRKVMQPIQDLGIDSHPGLILLISPKNTEVPLRSVTHHASKLKYCWLIATSQSLATAQEVKAAINNRFPNVIVNNPDDCLVDPENIESTFNKVDLIFHLGTKDYGLPENEIVADITGGLKPMTAGMALACFTLDRKMQYMKTLRDEYGDPLKGESPIPVQITLERDRHPGTLG